MSRRQMSTCKARLIFARPPALHAPQIPLSTSTKQRPPGAALLARSLSSDLPLPSKIHKDILPSLLSTKPVYSPDHQHQKQPGTSCTSSLQSLSDLNLLPAPVHTSLKLIHSTIHLHGPPLRRPQQQQHHNSQASQLSTSSQCLPSDLLTFLPARALRPADLFLLCLNECRFSEDHHSNFRTRNGYTLCHGQSGTPHIYTRFSIFSFYILRCGTPMASTPLLRGGRDAGFLSATGKSQAICYAKRICDARHHSITTL